MHWRLLFKAVDQEPKLVRLVESIANLKGPVPHCWGPRTGISYRHVLELIHEGSSLGYIPTSFEFTSAALADLVIVLFEIPADSPVTEEYVKIARQRARQGGKRAAASSKARRSA